MIYINWIKMTENEKKNFRNYQKYLITYNIGKTYVSTATFVRNKDSGIFRVVEYDLDINMEDIIAYVPINEYKE